jgi:hypothetical protein
MNYAKISLLVAPYAVILALIVGGTWYIRRLETSNNAWTQLARHDHEVELLRVQNVIAATTADRARMAQELDAATKANTMLGLELKRAQKAVQDSRVTSVERTSTGPTEAKVDVLAGQRVDLRVSEITTETHARTVALIGTAEAWLLDPPPERLLARAELHGTLVLESPPAPKTQLLPWWAHELIGVGAGAAGMLLLRR